MSCGSLGASYWVKRAGFDARAEQNLTQSELAERCGMKQGAIGRLEAGGSNPTLKTLTQVAEGLGKRLKISFV